MFLKVRAFPKKIPSLVSLAYQEGEKSAFIFSLKTLKFLSGNSYDFLTVEGKLDGKGNAFAGAFRCDGAAVKFDDFLCDGEP